jgi:dolichyl-phosphate beta-glucosyltransferase
VSLVIPAYNEATRLPRLIDALRVDAARELGQAGLALAEAVVVDDGSADGTGEVLREAAADVPAIKPVCSGGPNQGKGAAIALGVEHARGDLVLLSDVDLAAPIAEAEKLYEAIAGGADIAIGSRAIDRSEVTGIPLRRRVMARVFNALVRALSGLPHRDTQCGFKMMRASVARELFAQQTTQGFAFDVELLMRARAVGLRVAEVPIAYHHDADSRIAAGRASLRMARDVAGLAWRLRARRG